MRVTSILLAGVFALVANAQTNTGVAAPTTTDAATAAQASSLRCIEACKAGDVDCTSKCIAVPNPSVDQVNDTNACVTACPKGKGTEADNSAYATCVSGCINANYFTASAGSAQATSGSGSGSGSGSSSGSGSGSGTGNSNSDGSNNSENAGASGTSGNKASGTATGAAASSSTGAAQINHVSGAAAGLLGFMAAVLAL